jgi:NDP-sugar pyrophosphorylase family protein
MQCVILAGGLGTRMRERSGDLPKALIPVLGKPFIFYQLEWLAQQGIRDVVVSIGYHGKLVSEAVGDGARFGVAVAYADEEQHLRGTGGAVRLAADLGLLDPGFFLLYGDSYLPIDLPPVWRVSDHGRIPVMTVLRNEGRWDRSNVIFRDGTLILYDKSAADPAALGMDYIDYGLLVLTREAVQNGIAPGAIADLAGLLNRLSIKGSLKGCEVFQRFYEIGSPQGLDDFEAYLQGCGRDIRA